LQRKKEVRARFTPEVLATGEAEIGRIVVRGQPIQLVREILSPKITIAK
jgi:hypothetical protein